MLITIFFAAICEQCLQGLGKLLHLILYKKCTRNIFSAMRFQELVSQRFVSSIEAYLSHRKMFDYFYRYA